MWKEIYPGQDAIADAVFLYPQVRRGTTNFVMNGVLPYIIAYLCKAWTGSVWNASKNDLVPIFISEEILKIDECEMFSHNECEMLWLY